MIKTKKFWITTIILVFINIILIWGNHIFFLKTQFNTYERLLKSAISLSPENISDLCPDKINYYAASLSMDLSIIDRDGIILCSTETIDEVEKREILYQEEFKGVKKKKAGIMVRPDKNSGERKIYVAYKVGSYFIRGSSNIDIDYTYKYNFIIFFNIIIILFLVYISLSTRKMKLIPAKISESIQSSKSIIEDYSTLFDSISIGILIIDTNDNKVKYYNNLLKESVKIVGNIDQSYKLLFLNEDILTQIDQHIEGKGVIKEIEIDEKIYLITSTNIENNCFLFFNDITIIQANEAMKRQYIDAISHELKTPLTNILLYSEKLDGELKGELKKDNEKIYHNGETLKKLINDILQLSKLDSPNLELRVSEFSLRALFIQIMRDLSIMMDEVNVDLELNIKDLQFKGDRDLLYKMFKNIIENGVKYNKFGGMVKVENFIEGDIVLFKISDTGVGIPEKDLKNIFERFYRVEKNRSADMEVRTKGGLKDGTGLGLSIVRHVVNLHKGVIYLDSKVDEGTTFTIRLPLID